MKINIRLLLLFLFLFLTAFCFSAFADDEKWSYFATNAKNTKYYLNQKSVRYVDKGLAKLWVRIVFSKEEAEGEYKGLKELMVLWELDCSKRVYRETQGLKVLEDGKQMRMRPDSEWKTVAPDTVAEYLYDEMICKK